MRCGYESTGFTHINDAASADKVAEWDRIYRITGGEVMCWSIDMGASVGTHVQVADTVPAVICLAE
jgi:hypothetical protein